MPAHLTLTELRKICNLSHGCRSPVYQCEACPFRLPYTYKDMVDDDEAKRAANSDTVKHTLQQGH